MARSEDGPGCAGQVSNFRFVIDPTPVLIPAGQSDGYPDSLGV